MWITPNMKILIWLLLLFQEIKENQRASCQTLEGKRPGNSEEEARRTWTANLHNLLIDTSELGTCNISRSSWWRSASGSCSWNPSYSCGRTSDNSWRRAYLSWESWCSDFYNWPSDSWSADNWTWSADNWAWSWVHWSSDGCPSTNERGMVILLTNFWYDNHENWWVLFCEDLDQSHSTKRAIINDILDPPSNFIYFQQRSLRTRKRTHHDCLLSDGENESADDSDDSDFDPCPK